MQFIPTHNLITAYPSDQKWSRLRCVLFIAGAAALFWGLCALFVRLLV